MRTPTDSRVNTVTVPAFGAGGGPATLYQAADVALRIVVRNVGGANVLIAHDANALSATPPGLAGVFQLPVNASEIFVLQPRQQILAVAAGGGGTVSIAISEAIPVAWMES